jgi:hypothetical protein
MGWDQGAAQNPAWRNLYHPPPREMQKAKQSNEITRKRGNCTTVLDILLLLHLLLKRRVEANCAGKYAHPSGVYDIMLGPTKKREENMKTAFLCNRPFFF